MIFLLTHGKERALISADTAARARETMKLYRLHGAIVAISTPPADVEQLICYSDRVIEDVAVSIRANRKTLLPRPAGAAR